MKKSISIVDTMLGVNLIYTLNKELHKRDLKNYNDYKEYIYDITNKGSGFPEGDTGFFLVQTIMNLAKEVDRLKDRVSELEKESDK